MVGDIVILYIFMKTNISVKLATAKLSDYIPAQKTRAAEPSQHALFKKGVKK